jgi:hypothetical protein
MHTVWATAVDTEGHSTTTAATTVRVVDSVTHPWCSTDIGAPQRPGRAGTDGPDMVVAGGGSDIWGTADKFHFVSRRITGDGEIIARVTGLENTHSSAKAGLMIRADLTSGAPNALIRLRRGGYRSRFQWRSEPLGTTVSDAEGGSQLLPQWLKLVRDADVLSAFGSADGAAWTQLGSVTLALPASCYVGLAVTARNDSRLCTAVFDNCTTTFELDSDGDGIGDAADPDDDNDGMPDTWELAHGLDPFVHNGAPECDRDGDRVCDLHEYIAGTIPTNPASLPFVEQLTAGSGGGVKIVFDAVSGRCYRVECTVDAAEPAWQPLVPFGDVVGQGRKTAVLDTNHPGRCFYRFKVWWPDYVPPDP